MKQTEMIDGREALLAYVKTLHPREEISPAELLPGGKRELPPGFTVTDYDAERLLVGGPFDSVVSIMTEERFGGRVAISGAKLTAGLMLVAHLGEPLWDSSPEARKAWRLKQIEAGEPFAVPAREEFRNRSELERHLENCATCKPSAALLAEAVSQGSSRYEDRHIRELIELAHGDSDAAVKFYRGVLAQSAAAPRRKSPALGSAVVA